MQSSLLIVTYWRSLLPRRDSSFIRHKVANASRHCANFNFAKDFLRVKNISRQLIDGLMTEIKDERGDKHL